MTLHHQLHRHKKGQLSSKETEILVLCICHFAEMEIHLL